MSNKILIVGLGNPGKEYNKTRHNLGFMVIDKLASEYNIGFKGGFNGDYASKDIFGKRVYFLKPQTFMNLSGASVQSICNYFDISLDNIAVIHDDIDMEFGKIKIRNNGSAGGHNGIRSIIACMSSENFVRVKMGVGKPSKKNVSNFVLSDFSKEEFSVLEEFISVASDAVLCFIEKGVKEAMNKYNNKSVKEDEKCQV